MVGQQWLGVAREERKCVEAWGRRSVLLWRLETWEKRDCKTKRTENVGHEVSKRKIKWRKKEEEEEVNWECGTRWTKEKKEKQSEKKKKKRGKKVWEMKFFQKFVWKSQKWGQDFFLLHFVGKSLCGKVKNVGQEFFSFALCWQCSLKPTATFS